MFGDPGEMGGGYNARGTFSSPSKRSETDFVTRVIAKSLDHGPRTTSAISYLGLARKAWHGLILPWHRLRT